MTSPAFTLDSLFTSRSLKQYWQSLVARMFYPSCRADVVQELRRRARLGGEVSCSCRCGALTVVCQAAPRLVTVCHCSVCRYDEALSLKQDDAPAPSFAAVPRQSCWLKVSQNYRNENLLIFRHSSDFARRGRCKLCDTSLVMDYEWFEPSTVWLVRPVWQGEQTEKIEVEHMFNNGKADIDVCWNSRADACKSVTKVSYLGEEAVRERSSEEGVRARGVVQSHDLDFSYYYVDCGLIS